MTAGISALTERHCDERSRRRAPHGIMLEGIFRETNVWHEGEGDEGLAVVSARRRRSLGIEMAS